VLASAGLVVLCPFLPDFTSLRVRETVIADFARAFETLLSLDELPRGVMPGVFSISFGSLPALRLAADPRYASRVGAVVPFGGYAEFREVIRFSLSGGHDGRAPYDPLNRPVVVMNLLDDMEGVPAGKARVVDAWERYVRETWGRPEMRVDDRYKQVAERIGADLDGDERAFFRMGVGLDDGALERCLAALDRSRERRAFLDPRPHLGGLRAPVHLFHGADDDVIPWQQMDLLYEALPPHVDKARYLTGLYAHTGASALGSVAALLKEGVTLVRMLRAMVGAATTKA
jgi:pimeloyl-ACP methyl ester carboxylesterase